MNIVFFILPLALAFAGVMVWAFFWAARKGQFDDLDTPPLRLLMDDEFVPPPKKKQKPQDSTETELTGELDVQDDPEPELQPSSVSVSERPED